MDAECLYDYNEVGALDPPADGFFDFELDKYSCKALTKLIYREVGEHSQDLVSGTDTSPVTTNLTSHRNSSKDVNSGGQVATSSTPSIPSNNDGEERAGTAPAAHGVFPASNNHIHHNNQGDNRVASAAAGTSAATTDEDDSMVVDESTDDGYVHSGKLGPTDNKGVTDSSHMDGETQQRWQAMRQELDHVQHTPLPTSPHRMGSIVSKNAKTKRLQGGAPKSDGSQVPVGNQKGTGNGASSGSDMTISNVGPNHTSGQRPHAAGLQKVQATRR